MNAYAAAPSNAYKESSVLTATPQQLVVMLYDGARRFLLQGAVAMRQGAIAVANDRLQRAEAILDELTATLDMDAGEIASRLQGIYTFCRRALSEARINRDADKIDQVGQMLADLREAWSQASAA